MSVRPRYRLQRRRVFFALFLVCALGASPAAAQEEAIKLLGHWTIQVRNPDGSVASRHEFENQLIGHTLLAMVFNRELRLDTWLVELEPVGAPAACATEVFGFGNSCLIGEANETRLSGPSFFPTLTVARGGAASDVVILTGTATADNTGNIGIVRTYIATCSLPSGACGSSWASVTYKGLPNVIPVSQGQILDVVVRLSFSTAH